MKIRTLVLTSLAALALAVSIARSGPFDDIGNALGGKTGHILKATGHLAKAAAISEKDEDAMGQSVGVSVTNQYGVNDDEKLRTYVTFVGLTVASASPRPAGNYVFGVLNTDVVNAFSGPNGYIFVTRGAIARMKDEGELAGVLGHEIAHVCHHDGMHQLQSAETNQALSEGLQSDNQMARFSALSDAGIDVITKTGYSQPQEFDADKAGTQYMADAGYDPHSYLNFLKRLKDAQGSGGVQLMSTHPGIGDRVSKVSKQVKGMKAGGATLADRFVANVTVK